MAQADQAEDSTCEVPLAWDSWWSPVAISHLVQSQGVGMSWGPWSCGQESGMVECPALGSRAMECILKIPLETSAPAWLGQSQLWPWDSEQQFMASAWSAP